MNAPIVPGNLHKWVGLSLAAAALVVAGLNAATAPDELVAEGPIAVFLTAQVLGLIAAGLSLGAAAYSASLRWIDVFALLLMGLFTTAAADSSQLTGLLYGTVGLALAGEYGYLRRRTTLKLILWAAAYVLSIFIPVFLVRAITFGEGLKTATAAAVMCGIVWSVIRLRLQSIEEREQELALLVTERTSELGHALDAQKLLLKEIHHRTKNNLQLVSSMIHLEESYSDKPAVKKSADQSQARIRALARIHERLYATTNGGLTDLGTYLADYITDIRTITDGYQLGVDPFIELDCKVSLDMAIRASIMINEIVLNELEGSAEATQQSDLRLAARHLNGRLILTVDHELPTGSGVVPDSRQDIGIGLVEGLAQSLGGTAERVIDRGVHWRIDIPINVDSLLSSSGAAER